MADNQSNNNEIQAPDESYTAKIEIPANVEPIPGNLSETNVAIDNAQLVEQGTETPPSAAENYNELASKIFEPPQENANKGDQVTDTVPDVNQVPLAAEGDEIEDDKQEGGLQETTKEQGSHDSQEEIVDAVDKQEQTETPAAVNAEIETELNQSADKLEQVQEQTISGANKDSQPVDLIPLNLDHPETGNVPGLSEEEIIQRLQDVNQEVYNNDNANSFLTESETPIGNQTDQINDSNGVDSVTITEKPEGFESDQNGETDKVQNTSSEIRGDNLQASGNGDADQVDSNAVPSSSARNESITEAGGGDASTLADNTTDIDAPVSLADVMGNVQSGQVMSEVLADPDAEQMEQVYRDFARREHLAQQQGAAIIMGQQQHEQHHVTYADLPGQEGALTNNHQVSVSKRPHGQIGSTYHTHPHRGPLPQTAPSRLSISTTKSGHIPQIPSPPSSARSDKERNAITRNSLRLPPSLMRMSTVMVSARKRAVLNRQASTYFEEKQATKLVSLDQCINSRPPLPFDLDGPGPWHYSPRNKPLYETNAPEYSMGCKFYERGGGGRTAWAKTWFNSPDNFTRKVRWDRRWPSPNHYSPHSPLLGRPQASIRTYPAFSIGVRSEISINKRGSEDEPAPCQYNRDKADNLVMRSAPSFSMAKRDQATTLGKFIEKTPSPSMYRPKYKHMSSQVHYPSFTIRGIRKEKIHALGPHSTL